MLHLLIFSTFLLLMSISIHVWKQRRLRRGLPLPPGPKRLPILGNVFDLNVFEPWLTYTDWAKKYGMLHSGVQDGDSTIHCTKAMLSIQLSWDTSLSLSVLKSLRTLF
jgi:hypothetical protein